MQENDLCHTNTIQLSLFLPWDLPTSDLQLRHVLFYTFTLDRIKMVAKMTATTRMRTEQEKKKKEINK